MRVRLLFAAAVTLTLFAAACTESPTSPSSKAAPSIRKDDDGATPLECRAGYIVNTREDGSTECVPEDGSGG
jgi:hypothetical protein